MESNLSRRNFLKTAAVAGAASTIPACVNAAAPGPEEEAFKLNENPLKLGIMTFNLAKKWDLETLLNNLEEVGYQSVELRTTHGHGIEVTMSAAERAEVKKRLEDTSLEIITMASAFKYHYVDQAELKKSIEGTKEYALLVRDIGGSGFRVFPNELPPEVPEEQTLEQIGKSLAEVGEFAYNEGVEVRVCVHGKGTSYAPIIKKIIDYSGSPHVYVNWNCSENDLTGEGFDYNFNLLKDRIKSLHMHELWTDYPYRKLFRLLSEMNFKGGCNAEISGNEEDPIRLMQYYKALFLALQNAR